MVGSVQRTFEARQAVREAAPVGIGIVGPSSSGKTYSALRLLAGMQQITGGDNYVIDSESRRALHYADKFKFIHVPFGAPFSPLDYLAAVEYCVDKGAKNIMIDSGSHEHEGPGGVLEWHAAEKQRLGGKEKHSLPAWAAPKAARRRFLNGLLQMPCNLIVCFRAKEKLKINPGQDPIQMGWSAIAAEEWIYDLTLKCLLLPQSNGYPLWESTYPAEKQLIKLPEQFRPLFAGNPQLSEEIGRKIAEWARGTVPSRENAETVNVDAMVASYRACSDHATFRSLEQTRRSVWHNPTLPIAAKEMLTVLAKDTKVRIDKANETTAPPEPEREDEAPAQQGPTRGSNGQPEADSRPTEGGGRHDDDDAPVPEAAPSGTSGTASDYYPG